MGKACVNCMAAIFLPTLHYVMKLTHYFFCAACTLVCYYISTANIFYQFSVTKKKKKSALCETDSYIPLSSFKLLMV